MNIKSEQEMIRLGRDFARKVQAPAVIELIGDVGAGKTTFVRGLAEGLGVKEAISSPSFTILKVYALPGGGELKHYDFYRLAEPGIMAEELEESFRDKRNIIIIEWGESVQGILPEERIRVKINYTEEGREVSL
ncbi:tRNA (adenosine(37)-N6)-threonylcarbamoyltransferase complex ATPase subunit type 1 TsaE [Candidatus Saccharibacteria bacterium]|nr:tRNA (adenosine(37)-N6)-threonylcarbamoyltransferase complex ATPase subunit type 1 TsaE [Candidatus Saccharibacteria bacterium]